MIKNFIPKENLLFWIVSIITILGALFIRLHGLSDYYYTSDEAWHLVVASQKNLVNVLDYNFANEFHPPLSPIIWHYMLKISDNGLWIRSASYIPSILIIPSIYIFGRIFIGEAAAFTMAMLTAFGLLPVISGTVVRAYPLMVLALIWAGIFTHKYMTLPKLKYFGCYFICAFMALELNHAVFIMIFTFGTMFMWVSYKNKNKLDLFIIIIAHIFLAMCLISYLAILKYYNNFPVGYAAFTIYNNLIDFLFQSLIKLGMFCSELMYVETKNIGDVIAGIAIVIVPYFIIKKKNWLLLHIIFTPFIVVSILDYSKLYFFSTLTRHNLFMFTSVASIIGYFAQLNYDYIKNLSTLVNCNSTPINIIWKNKDIGVTKAIYISITRKLPTLSNYIRNHKELLFSIFIISIPVSLTINDYHLDSFRELPKSGREFELRKSTYEQAIKYLKEYQNQDNSFLITDNVVLWFFLLSEMDNHIKIEKITDSFSHFKSDNYSFYFENYSILGATLYTEEKIFSSAIEYLKKPSKMSKIENIIYLHFGGKTTAFDTALYPQFIKDKILDINNKSLQNKMQTKLEEDYNFSWSLLASDQVKTKIFLKDYRYNSSLVLIEMTPKFIEDNLIGKHFTEYYGKFNNTVN